MNDERMREGVEHLQAAALELIEAARAFLDVAEDVVKDPATLVELVAEAAQQAQSVARHGPKGGARGDGQPRVERIRVV